MAPVSPHKSLNSMEDIKHRPLQPDGIQISEVAIFTAVANWWHVSRSMLLMALALIVMAGCAVKQIEAPPAPEEAPEYWSMTRVVNSDAAMITLFDPNDLAHHLYDPAEWMLHDFAYQHDLESGRFAAVLTGKPGSYHVRMTHGPLTAEEKAQAGPRAGLRLRVRNSRLLLSGGDAWPSQENQGRVYVFDERWVSIPNGDYQVLITTLDPAKGARHHYVFQLLPVDNIKSVKYTKGLPQLVLGQPTGIVGINAGGHVFRDQCNDVPEKVIWAPLVAEQMPVPGAIETVEVPKWIHERGMALQASGKNSAQPIVMVRHARPGNYGFYIRPDEWNKNQIGQNRQANVKTLIRCAVRIERVVSEIDEIKLVVKAIPNATDQLASSQKQQLLLSFNDLLRQNGDPAWRFKSAMLQRTADDRSLVLAVLKEMQLSPGETETLLPQSNGFRTNFIIERISQAYR